jgi:hypothetical protein
VQAVDALESHKSQRDGLSVLDLVRGQLDRLGDCGLLGVLDILKAEGRLVDDELDGLGSLGGDYAGDGERADADGLVELGRGGTGAGSGG